MAWIIEFQSAPANYGGRIDSIGKLWDSLPGFNPRPPITAGESAFAEDFPKGFVVSIRARQLRRANQPRGHALWRDPVVSIRARQLRRANHSLQRPSATGGGRCPPASIARIFGTISSTVARNAAVIATSRRRRELW